MSTGGGSHDLVVVANRLPVQRSAISNDGWETSPGGLVRAMFSVLHHRRGAWVGWTGTAGDAPEPFEHDGVRLRPVRLSRTEIEQYYEGLSNEALWPLYHDAIRPSTFESAWWETYVRVNERFAEAAAEEACEGAAVWVHDYHLQLVPLLLRELRPDVRIGFFLHIPFPPQELFMRLPWREEVLRGLLGADVIGFQRRVAAENFAAVARRLVGAEGEPPLVHFDGRTVQVGTFPISIDVAEFDEIARRPETAAHATEFRHRLGDPHMVLLGVDRLDYTKGIDVRLEAYQTLLRDGELDARRCVMVQIAVPTREGIDYYEDERRRVEELVGEINGEFGAIGYPAVHYLHQSLPLDELVALYQAADVMIVTPLRDGMNLVAKEFAASRIDEHGVLVLSEFAGAADELTEAVLVNPHDRDAVQRAILDAVDMEPKEARVRMAAIRETVAQSDVRQWAAGFLTLLGVASTAA
jgi:trehalose 6-phosphate synthase